MSRHTQNHALLGITPAVFDEAQRPGINLTVWQRRRNPALARLADTIIAHQTGGICLYVGPGDTTDAITAALVETGWACPTSMALLGRDVALLANRYLGLVRAPRVHIDLAIVATDSCRYFHVDNTDLRLLCTYAGPGTEWLPNDAVWRENLGKGSNAEVIRTPGRVQHLKPGWVGLFRGERETENAGNGIVHRSAPILRRGERRLLLRIDEPGPHLPPE